MISRLKQIFVHPYAGHPSYWGSSDFAKWVTSTFADPELAKETSMTIEGWAAWRELYSVNYPKTYWFTEYFLDKIQNIVTYPYRVYKELRHIYNNGIRDKTHIVSTGAEWGTWMEYDRRLLNASFNLLVDHVENDRTLDTLKWETELVFTEEELGWFYKDPGDLGKPTPQAIKAKEILELYYWWTTIYRNRPDPWKAIDSFKGGILDMSEQTREAAKEASHLEDEWYKEETEMLVRLMQVRQHLWT